MAKILCAEDEPGIAAVIEAALSNAGHEVLVCSYGRDVLPAIESFMPQALVLDVMMPGMDGMAILHKLAANPATSRLPVVVATALVEIKKNLESFPQVRGFLPKPFSLEALVETVHYAITVPWKPPPA
ncbi:MAG: response regulator [Elusimicrobia bacterium]|nr:response regulator [Elusimicrobiota bacterium]